MGRDTVGGAELVRGTSCKHGNLWWHTDTEGHSYSLRFKLRAVAAAKKSIITAAVQEFGVDSGVDITINTRFE